MNDIDTYSLSEKEFDKYALRVAKDMKQEYARSRATLSFDVVFEAICARHFLRSTPQFKSRVGTFYSREFSRPADEIDEEFVQGYEEEAGRQRKAPPPRF